MTPAERKALREKHQPQPHTEWFPVCATCNTQSPCDVIKVLNAWNDECGQCDENQLDGWWR